MPIGVSGGGGGTASGLTEDSILVSTGGTVQNGESGVCFITELEDQEILELDRVAFTQPDGTAIPSGVDLILAELDNTGGGRKETTIQAGDGASIYDDLVGSPFFSYTSTKGSSETFAVLADNGNFGSGTGSSQDVSVGLVGQVTF